MNKTAVFLALSQAMNAAFAAVLVSRSQASRNEGKNGVGTSSQRRPAPETKSAFDEANWEKLSRGSDQDLIARLRAQGFPQAILRVVAMSRVDERFADRRKALAAKAGPRPYWRSTSPPYSTAKLDDPRLRPERRALDEEYAAAIEQLIGEYYSDDDRARHLREYGAMPADKVRQIEAINRDYAEISGKIRESMNGVTFPEDRTQLEFLEKERREDLTRVLTPGELEDYDLRGSDTAKGLRNQLSIFDPNEAEYRAIFKVQAEFERQYANVALTADESRRLREAQIKTVLSPERFDDYRVKTSGSYRPVRELVASFDLPTEAIAQVIGTQHDITLRADQIRADANLTADQRKAQLAVLSEEAAARLTKALGPAGFDAYRNFGGFWLNPLRPKASASKEN